MQGQASNAKRTNVFQESRPRSRKRRQEIQSFIRGGSSWLFGFYLSENTPRREKREGVKKSTGFVKKWGCKKRMISAVGEGELGES